VCQLCVSLQAKWKKAEHCIYIFNFNYLFIPHSFFNILLAVVDAPDSFGSGKWILNVRCQQQCTAQEPSTLHEFLNE
jgi:hypothetical protein